MRYEIPKGMRHPYTDMAIYIDKHIYEDDCDEDTIFKYMYLMAYLSAKKERYFSKAEDYDDFAMFLAEEVYVRMKCFGDDHIKSVKNYMNSIMYFRKVGYQQSTFSQVFKCDYDDGFDALKCKQESIRKAEALSSNLLTNCINDVLGSLPAIVEKSIPKSVDKSIRGSVKTSALLSLLYRYSMVKDRSLSATFGCDFHKGVFKVDTYYDRRHDPFTIILWHLDRKYEDVVRLTINKALYTLKIDVQDVIDEFKMDEETFDMLMIDELQDEGKIEGEEFFD